MNGEITIGIIVTLVQIGLLIYALYKIQQLEERSPTETLLPE